MFDFRRSLAAIVIGAGIFARPVRAQTPASSSLTHVVSVTVPPRVRVQVGQIPLQRTAVKLSSSSPIAGGLGLSISATQPWVLSIAAAGSDARSLVQWSVDQSAGYATLTSTPTSVASGGVRSAAPTGANVFFRQSAAQSHRGGEENASIVLLVAAP